MICTNKWSEFLDKSCCDIHYTTDHSKKWCRSKCLVVWWDSRWAVGCACLCWLLSMSVTSTSLNRWREKGSAGQAVFQVTVYICKVMEESKEGWDTLAVVESIFSERKKQNKKRLVTSFRRGNYASGIGNLEDSGSGLKYSTSVITIWINYFSEVIIPLGFHNFLQYRSRLSLGIS